MFPALPKVRWKWLKLWISIASVQMPFNIWMSNSSNRKLSHQNLFDGGGYWVCFVHITFITHWSTNWDYTKQLLICTFYLLLPVHLYLYPQLVMSHLLPLPFEAWIPAYLVKTTKCNHRSALQLKETEDLLMIWFAHHRVKKLYIVHMCTTLRVARFSK